MFGPISFAPALARADRALVLIFVLCGTGTGREVTRSRQVTLPTTPEDLVPPFGEDTAGYNLHHDRFYSDEVAVAEDYKRSDYTSAKVTLAGQAPDATGHTVTAARRPFAVGQKSSSPFGTSDGRWDVKENINGYQFFAIYNGFRGSSVANILRRHLLRRVANEIKDKLPILDRLGEQESKNRSTSDHLSIIKTEIKGDIMFSLALTHDQIKNVKTKDNSGASATLAIITDRYVITANAGMGRVVACDTNNEISVLAAPQDCPFPFGAIETELEGLSSGRSENRTCTPEVYIKLRSRVNEDGGKTQLAFLLLESSTIAKLLDYELPVGIVVSEAGKHRNEPSHEQDFYASSVTSIINLAHHKANWISPPDFTLTLVGLVDYSLIH